MEWTGSEDDVDGYTIYYGTESGNYTNATVLGSVTQATIGGLVSGATYYCVVTAYKGNEESDPSNEVSGTPP